MHILLRKCLLLVLAGCIFGGSGCMSFTQKDYELQEKAYQKERQQKEEASKGTLRMDW